MADSFWRYAAMAGAAAAAADPRQMGSGAGAPAVAQNPAVAPTPPMSAPPAGGLKRPRTDFSDAPGGIDMGGFFPRAEAAAAAAAYGRPRDTDALNASYERYLRNGMPSYVPPESVRPLPGGSGNFPVDDPRMLGVGPMDNIGASFGRREPRLPPDASKTLFVEGLPANCSRREVSHIFRPFVGFEEVRLVNKESRHPGGDPLVLCFVDFTSPAEASVALEALQGYRFDEHEPNSPFLRLQYARFPGPRSGGGPGGARGRR